MVSRTIFIKTNNFRRIRRAILAYVRCGGLAHKGLISRPQFLFVSVTCRLSPFDVRRAPCAVRRTPSAVRRALCTVRRCRCRWRCRCLFPCNCRCRFRCRCPCHYRSRCPCPCSCLCVCLCLYCPSPCPCICPCPCLCLSARPCPSLSLSPSLFLFLLHFANKIYNNSNLNRQGGVGGGWGWCQFSRLLAAEVCASAFMVGSNAGYIMFRGDVNDTGYPLHSPVSPSLPLPCVACVITFQLNSTTTIHHQLLPSAGS